MRKLLLALLLLLVAVPCLAGGGATMMMIGGTAAAAGGGCDAASNEIGDRTQEATSGVIAGDYAWVERFQADCSGNLANAYFYHNNTLTSDAAICIYNSTTADLTAEDGATLVGCANVTADGTTGWKSAAVSGTNPVVSGNYYWRAIFQKSTGNQWTTVRGATAGKTLYSRSASGYYASNPNPLIKTGWTTNADFGPVSAYVEIGP